MAIAFISVGVLLAIAPADAEVRVALTSPPECPALPQLRDDIEAATGGSVGTGAPADFDVRVTPHDGRYELRVATRGTGEDPPEIRTIMDADCSALVRAAAVMIAVAIEPVALAERRVQRPSPIQRTTPATVGPSDRVAESRPDGTAPRQPSTRRRAHRVLLAALGGVSTGAVPDVAPALVGVVGGALGPLRLEGSVEHVFERAVAIVPGARIAAASTGGGITLAFEVQAGAVILFAGTGVRAGILRGSGRGSRVRGRTAREPWVAVPILFGAEWPARSRLAVRAQVEASVGARRASLALDGAAGPWVGFRRAPVGFAAVLGPIVRLP